jgi:hypothetical protein
MTEFTFLAAGTNHPFEKPTARLRLDRMDRIGGLDGFDEMAGCLAPTLTLPRKGGGNS